jgi:hypothetical protein
MGLACKRPLAEPDARWKEADQITGRCAAYDRMSQLSDKIWPLAEAAVEVKASTVAGLDVLAAAALVIGDDWDCVPHARERPTSTRCQKSGN